MGIYEENYLMHHGIKGQRKGVRRAEWYPIAAYEAHLANGGESRSKGGASSETYRKRADKVSSKKSKLESKNESLNKQKNVYNAKTSQAKVNININTSQNNISRIKNKYAKRDLYDIPHRAKTEKKVSKEESNISKNSEILSKYSALADELQAKIDSNTVKIDKYETKIDKLMAKADKKADKEAEKRKASEIEAYTNTIDEYNKLRDKYSKNGYIPMTERANYDRMQENAKWAESKLAEINGVKSTGKEALGEATNNINNKMAKGEEVTVEDAKKAMDAIDKKKSRVDFDEDTVERVKGGSVNPKNYASKAEKIQNSSKTDEAKDRKLAKLDADYARNYYYDSETGETKKGYTGPKYSSILDAKKQSLKDKVSKSDYNGDRVATVTADDAKRLGLNESTRITGKEESDFWKAYANYDSALKWVNKNF